MKTHIEITTGPHSVAKKRLIPIAGIIVEERTPKWSDSMGFESKEEFEDEEGHPCMILLPTGSVMFCWESFDQLAIQLTGD